MQTKSFFCTSGTLSPLMWAGAMHCVKGAKPRLALSQSESQDRWQSQWRLLECRRLKWRKKGFSIIVIITFSCHSCLSSNQRLCLPYILVMWQENNLSFNVKMLATRTLANAKRSAHIYSIYPRKWVDWFMSKTESQSQNRMSTDVSSWFDKDIVLWKLECLRGLVTSLRYYELSLDQILDHITSISKIKLW